MLTRKRGNTAGKNRDKKGQSANEAMMLITLLTFFLIVTLTAVSDDLIRASDNNYREMLQDIADVIEAEANIAFSSENGYTHTFTLPQTLNGQPYAISIINSSQIGSQANTTILSIASTRPNVPLNVTRLLPRDVLGNVVVGENTVRKEQGIVILMALPLPPPIVSSVSPSSGSTVGGTSVTIYGSDFINTPTAPTVTFGGAPASVTSSTSNTISVVTPAHAAGSVDVVVTNPDGQSFTLNDGFTYVAPPSITSVTPDSGSTVGGTPITISGDYFQSGLTVTIGASVAAGVVVSPDGKTITATTSSSVTAGAKDVTVTNPDGQFSILPSAFTYVFPPSITSVSPLNGPYTGGTAVTVTGSNFVSGAAVTFGSVAAASVIFVSSTQLTAVSPAHAAGAVDVVVTNPDGQFGTLVNGFTYVPPPTVSSVSPPSGPTAGGTSVTVTGSNFVSGAAVTFGSVAAASVIFVSSTQLTAVSPAHAVGDVNVVVTNPDGQFYTLVNGFKYEPLSVTSITPNSGSTVGGTSVTIAGNNFVSGAAVTFGSVAAASVIFVSSTQLTAVSPAHAAGAVDVVVTNPDGQFGTLVNGFTYVPPPTVSSVSPPSGPTAGGTSVTVTGSNFVSGAAVTFGSVAAASVIFVSSTQLTAVSPAHAAGAVNVVVKNPDLQFSTQPITFTYGANGEQCSSGGECVSGNCYVDADGDRYAPSSGTKTCRVQTQLPGTDCNDADVAMYQMLTCYYDGDSDSYTVSSGTSRCKGATCSTPADSYKPISSPTDCYDSSANAKPGQTSYFTTHRGDGSFDYNCDSVETKLMNCLTTFSSTVACTSPMPSGNSGYSEEVASYVTQWGSYGFGDGQFESPYGVAVDSSSNVYVADRWNWRIQKFTSSGTFLTKWGSSGSGDGQFGAPYGVAVDSSNNIYVADRNNNRIQKFTSSGTFLTKWGSSGSGNGQFNGPQGVAVDSSNNVYVVDTGNYRIQKFTSSGSYITKWGSFGSGNGNFWDSYGVAVDSSNNVYVSDTNTNNNRIQKFTSSGTYITKWGSSGSGDGQFNAPHGVAVDSSGNVYVADRNNNRIQKFTSSGVFLTKWGSSGSGNGQFSTPHGVAVDSSNNIYVADTNNNRIQKFILSVIIPACGASGTYKYCKSYYSSGCSIGEESAYCGPCKTTALGLTAIRWDITQNSRTQQCN